MLAVMNALNGTDPTIAGPTYPSCGNIWSVAGVGLEQSAALDLEKNDPASALEKFESILCLAELSPELRQRAIQLKSILESADK